MKFVMWLWRRISDLGSADWIVGLLGGWRVVASGVSGFFAGGVALGEGLPLWKAILVGLGALVLSLAAIALCVWLVGQIRRRMLPAPIGEMFAAIQFRLEPAGPRGDFRVTAVIKGNRHQKDVATLGRMALAIHTTANVYWNWSPSARLESKDSIYPNECWEIPILRRSRKGPNVAHIFDREIALSGDSLVLIEVSIASANGSVRKQAAYFLQEVNGALLLQPTHLEDVAYIKGAELDDQLERSIPLPASSRNAASDELVPINEALKELFDKARNSIVIKMTPVIDASEDERLSWLVSALWGKVPLQVRLLISNEFEPLPHTIQRGRRVAFKDGKPLLMSADRRTNEEHVEAREISILRVDLDRAIAIFKAQA